MIDMDLWLFVCHVMQTLELMMISSNFIPPLNSVVALISFWFIMEYYITGDIYETFDSL